MSIDRRYFLKGAGASLFTGMFFPKNILGNDVNPFATRKKDPLHFDVIVVGAGPAGVPAAIAAAENGAKVVLLEEDMNPGGAPVDMFVTFACGAPRTGVYRKMIQELNANYTLSGRPVSSFGKDGMDGKNHWWHPTSYLQVINKMIANTPNLTLMCGVNVYDVILKEKGNRNVVQGVRINRGGMQQDIKGKVTIDATGTGLISEKAGSEILFGRESKKDFNENIGLDVTDRKTQPCTWMFISQRVRKDAILPREKLRGGVVEDNLNQWVMKDKRDEMIERDAGIYLHWGRTTHCNDTRDTVALAESQKKCLQLLEDDIRALYEAGFTCNLAPKMGVREVRRVVGEYILTATDLQNGVMHDDKIADAHYDIDAWGMKLKKEQKIMPPYGIPYRSLIPVGVDGLLTAGRIISGTHIAASSYRVQPICSNIGEAAGTAAAMASLNNTGVRSIEIKKLQNALDKRGMFDGYK